MCFILYSQSYSDWKDLNLKDKPKSVIEARIFSQVSISDSSSKILFREPSILMIGRFEKYFDINGLIIKSFYKEKNDSIGKWSDDNDIQRHIYKDSVIYESFYAPGIKSRTEKYFLNKSGFPLVKIGIGFPCPDTIILYRNKKNQITKEYYEGRSIDTWTRSVTQYELNSNGDILKASLHFLDSHHGGGDHENFVYVTEYKYIYDSNDNWIVKVTIGNNKVTSITERKFEYY